MNPSKQRQVLDQIVSHLSYDRRKKINVLTFYWRGSAEVRRLAKRTSRLLKTEEEGIKMMKWKKVKLSISKKTNVWRHNSYYIVSDTPNQFRLQWHPEWEDGQILLGTLPDIETAKYIVYLLTKKH